MARVAGQKEIVNWCRDNDIWYLQMDIEIPEACIAEAQAVYDEGFFVNHRGSDGEGWLSAGIHSFVHKDEESTDLGWRHTKNPSGHGMTEEEVIWGYTEIAEIAPETKRWLEEFPHKHYRRCRFMLLAPNGYIEQHHDSNEPRDRRGDRRNIASAINLAFYQPLGNCHLSRIHEDGSREALPFKNCTGFWFDNGVEHEAKNETKENRFHFIMHGAGNNHRIDLMKKSIVKTYGNDALKEIEASAQL